METWARESRLRLAVMCCLTIREDEDEDADDNDDDDNDNADDDDDDNADDDDEDDDDDEPGGQAASEGRNVGKGTQVKAGLPMDRFFFVIICWYGWSAQSICINWIIKWRWQQHPS